MATLTANPATPTPTATAAPAGRLLTALSIALPVLVFLAIALYHITLPGLYYDEAADAVPAMYLLQGRQPELVRPHGIPFFGLTLPLMAFDYVGAIHTYAVLPFFALLGPGVESLRLMTISGAAATVGLTAWWAGGLFRSRGVGGAAGLLLATHPSFVFYARQGVHVSSLMALWLMAALALLLVWRQTGRGRWLAGAAFFVGLGVSTKILFVWVAVALVVIYAGGWLLHRIGGSVPSPLMGQGEGEGAGRGGGPAADDEAAVHHHANTSADRRGPSVSPTALSRPPTLQAALSGGHPPNPLPKGASAPSALPQGQFHGRPPLASRPPLPSPLMGEGQGEGEGAVEGSGGHPPYPLAKGAGAPSALPQLGLAVLGFLAGAAPLIVYNLQTGATFEAVGKSAEVTAYGVRNADYPTNLLARLDTLGALLTGDHFWFLGGLFGNPLFGAATAVGAFVLLAGVWRRREWAAAFLLGFIGLFLLQSPFTVSGIWPTHLFVLLPLLATVPALALWRLAHTLTLALSQRERVPMLWAAPAAATAGVLLLAAGNLYADAQYHAALVRTGGHRGHSDAVYKLASYLDNGGFPAPLAMDWGIRYSVELVTQGRVRPQEVFGYTPDPDPAFPSRLPLDTPEQRYIFHGEDYTAFDRLGAFEQAARDAGKQAHLEETFYERSGTPIYLVYSVR